MTVAKLLFSIAILAIWGILGWIGLFSIILNKWR